MKWLQEGDENSKKFHNVMSTCRRRNALNIVSVDRVTVEGVQDVRTTVFTHFSNHFKQPTTVRPCVDSLSFRKLDNGEAEMLIKPFSVEEVKQAVWDCGSFKSPGADGIDFGFLKEFWELLKDDFMKFIVDFHRNGKLTKGVNSTFIALIPKVSSPQQLNDFRCHTLILDLKILVQISFLFLTLFQFTVYYSAIYHCASAAYVIVSVF